MLITVVIALAVIGLSVLLLGIKVFFLKDGQFPNVHLEENAQMREKGIACARSQDRLLRSQRNLYELMDEKY
jgi:hypothetical protein